MGGLQDLPCLVQRKQRVQCTYHVTYGRHATGHGPPPYEVECHAHPSTALPAPTVPLTLSKRRKSVGWVPDAAMAGLAPIHTYPTPVHSHVRIWLRGWGAGHRNAASDPGGHGHAAQERSHSSRTVMGQVGARPSCMQWAEEEEMNQYW
ncbi:hypothetical protein IAQ61_009971 [Plenodomus lingam]|uniref:uncharacterized protein n=1 Tax=Leptosphaeria maculans TaxID=5022 RepID=UPI003332A468|nr:hypothetical protein IAQ61_009971 [Plenodomus lingam]